MLASPFLWLEDKSTVTEHYCLCGFNGKILWYTVAGTGYSKLWKILIFFFSNNLFLFQCLRHCWEGGGGGAAAGEVKVRVFTGFWLMNGFFN